MRRPLLGTSLAAALLLGACAAPTSPATPDTVQGHVAAAKAAAGADLQPLLVLCNPPPATRPPADDSGARIRALIHRPVPPPGQAFDNLFYVGANWVSAWAIKTSDGIILVDALNNAEEVRTVIVPGMQKLGLDPAQIKMVVVTHGHGDHYGGVNYLVQQYKPRIVMSELDWKMTETKLEFETPAWDPPPKRDAARDLAVKDGDTVTLGDTTLRLYITPGHTMGTLSPVFEAKSGGRTHRTLLWGGTAFNFGKDFPRLDSYIAATDRTRTLAAQQSVDVLLSNHAGYDDSFKKLATLRQQPGGPNPFVMGTPAVQRALTVMNECARATRDRFELQP